MPRQNVLSAGVASRDSCAAHRHSTATTGQTEKEKGVNYKEKKVHFLPSLRFPIFSRDKDTSEYLLAQRRVDLIHHLQVCCLCCSYGTCHAGSSELVSP